jgi:chorismate mutase
VRSEIQQRIDELSREIRNYPTPIARCDEQLAGLLEERAELMTQLHEIETKAGGCTPLGIWTNDGGFNAA